MTENLPSVSYSGFTRFVFSGGAEMAGNGLAGSVVSVDGDLAAAETDMADQEYRRSGLLRRSDQAWLRQQLLPEQSQGDRETGAQFSGKRGGQFGGYGSH
ncbi:hypothetical protein FJW05_25460 [Mesorhizobium sp. B2-9-1]|uniref:hypothetical protein n=1 Tax=Mesorhizobium sp. B2-9-1 TaxID=2589898 RepID=UPI00112EE2DF|nr:hypothetical protein [Mesorhizobium sp. B2-9-1]TPI38965.1 hypothetical protein FJW05_25460 [Mesorhizobium sp. B2-9-1]